MTTVEWYPSEGRFHVERRLVGVSKDFLRCDTTASCTATITSLLNGNEAPVSSPASQLRDRLLSSGATDVEVTLESEGNRLTIHVAYNALLGTKAADETDIFVEWLASLAVKKRI